MEKIAGHGCQSLAEHIGNGFDVGNIAGNEPANLGGVEKTDFQPKQVAVQTNADIANDGLAEPGTEVGLKIGADGLKEQNAEHDEHHVEQAGITFG